MNTEKNINCPNCGQQIDVNDILYHQLQETVKKEYNSKYADLERQKSEFDAQVNSQVKLKIHDEKNIIKKQIEDETAEEIRTYKEQLDEKSSQLREFNKLRADFEKVLREKNEMKENMEFDYEQKYSQKLSNEKEQIKRDIESKSALKLSEKDHVINQLNEKLKEAQRKAEQGSMQIQGDVQELAIEDYLKANFPFDTIEEIKKGSRGADCLQIVHTRERQSCGSIYYESKRTKDFQNSWIEKFKIDMREKNATFGILVTEKYPDGIERMTQINSIWVCSFEEFKALCFVLRESVILLSNSMIAQENKGSKVEMIYTYLTGSEFRSQIEAIVEGFSQMQNDLNSEKRAMESIWKKREKQIAKVLLNTTHMYSTVKGIAGNAVRSIKELDLNTHDEQI